MEEPAGLAIKAWKRNWKESEWEVFQETAPEKATQALQYAGNKKQKPEPVQWSNNHFKFSSDKSCCASLIEGKQSALIDFVSFFLNNI